MSIGSIPEVAASVPNCYGKVSLSTPPSAPPHRVRRMHLALGDRWGPPSADLAKSADYTALQADARPVQFSGLIPAHFPVFWTECMDFVQFSGLSVACGEWLTALDIFLILSVSTK